MKKKIHYFVRISFLIVLLLLPAACYQADEPSPFESHNQPPLQYRPYQKNKLYMKYPLTLGVFNVKDCRNLLFYNDEDNYYSEKIPEAVSKMMFYEMKTSGIFKEVIMINEVPPENITLEYLRNLREKYKINMALFTDLTRFNMLREKEGNSFINTFKITVDIEFISQLIYLKNGYVVWADTVDRNDKELAENGALDGVELGKITENALKSSMNDMKLLMVKTGKVMKRR